MGDYVLRHRLSTWLWYSFPNVLQFSAPQKEVLGIGALQRLCAQAATAIQIGGTVSSTSV